MPTVRCPACQRALTVSQSALGETARCPLCGVVFPVPGPEGESWSQIGPTQGAFSPLTDRVDQNDTRNTLSPERQSQGASSDAEAALTSASRWLSAAAVCCLTQTVVGGPCCCWTFDLLIGGVSSTNIELLSVVMGVVLIRALLSCWYGRFGQALGHGRHIPLGWPVGVFLLVDFLLSLLITVGLTAGVLTSLAVPADHAQVLGGAVLLLFSLATAGCCLTASIKLFLLLSFLEGSK